MHENVITVSVITLIDSLLTVMMVDNGNDQVNLHESRWW